MSEPPRTLQEDLALLRAWCREVGDGLAEALRPLVERIPAPRAEPEPEHAPISGMTYEELATTAVARGYTAINSNWTGSCYEVTVAGDGLVIRTRQGDTLAEALEHAMLATGEFT